LVAQRLQAVQERIAAACERSGRSPEDVTLVVVTKQRSVQELREVLDAGALNIGENYVQEAMAKHAEIGAGPTWHFIGHLQRNKAAHAVRVSDWIHSVDSVRLGREISKRAVAVGKDQQALLEVNMSGEAAKWGVAPHDAEQVLATVRELPGLRLRGLMAMTPLVDDPELGRPVFRGTRELAQRLADRGLFEDEPQLSMGMTNDFEVAVEEGATMVRIGTAVFGPRQY